MFSRLTKGGVTLALATKRANNFVLNPRWDSTQKFGRPRGHLAGNAPDNFVLNPRWDSTQNFGCPKGHHATNKPKKFVLNPGGIQHKNSAVLGATSPQTNPTILC